MTRRKIPVRNREDLALERRLAPFIETCATFLVGNGHLHSMSRHPSSEAPQGDWIVMKDATGAGFGVWARLEGGQTTPMRNALTRVHTLRAIARACRATNEVPLVLVDDRTPPKDWGVFKVITARGTTWCSLSEESPTGMPLVERSASVPTVRVRVFADLDIEVSPVVGQRLSAASMRVRIPEFVIEGCFVCEREGAMAIEVTSADEVQREVLPAVRVDLGELEIPLADVLGLRAGTVVKLGPRESMKCFLRIGSSTLAEGEFRTSEEGEFIEITRVL